MLNCTVKLYSTQETLTAGHRSSETHTLLYEGPARFSAPKTSWQQVAALEGALSGSLQVTTGTVLQATTRAEVTDWKTGTTTTYEVSNVGHAPDGGWGINLGARV
ncbi:hypothetical protein [Deinococcus cellulosilyticus]|uniref:Uncharacterized protein n=1 Tax=Deinococcus cellulosilyticus (strain DSM 18568 / NBRC 106333 / KACC 11606 / 5516J-15) TaxID=1223518 RepID=A0A511N4A5_DEIC1|nr:hypothetical protein [Deinococcus cellulosilyticus]GEM47211.1 hypothetical protein DC3_28460 [Deinococcus cellulosilyticus NBRC 106333 = KACC 11606]